MLQRDVAMLRADSWWRTVIVCDRVLPYHLVTGLTFVGAVAAPTMACLKPGRGVVRWLDAAVCAECAPGAVGVPLYALLPWVTPHGYLALQACTVQPTPALPFHAQLARWLPASEGTPSHPASRVGPARIPTCWVPRLARRACSVRLARRHE